MMFRMLFVAILMATATITVTGTKTKSQEVVPRGAVCYDKPQLDVITKSEGFIPFFVDTETSDEIKLFMMNDKKQGVIVTEYPSINKACVIEYFDKIELPVNEPSNSRR